MFKMFYPDAWVASTYDIPFEKLYKKGYRGIIFEDVRSRERQKPAERGLLANHSSRASLWECYGCTRQENDMGVYQ